jgi:hypothetical protein
VLAVRLIQSLSELVLDVRLVDRLLLLNMLSPGALFAAAASSKRSWFSRSSIASKMA